MAPLIQDPVEMAYRYARRLGMPREDAQDCAMDYRLHLLCHPNLPTGSEAWIRSCAHNYACNYLRAQIRRRQRERDGAASAPCHTGLKATFGLRLPGPRTLALRRALWEQLFSTLRQFTPEQRDLFIRYHVREQSWQELTQRTGRSAHALQQSLYHIHKRLACLLVAQGWSAQDAVQLFAVMPQPCFPRRQA